jgi:general secretion pathway protein M
MSLQTTLAPLQARWERLAVRERTLLKLVTALVLVTLLWVLMLAPAIATLRAADTQGRALDAQLQTMLSLQAQARSLQQQPALAYAEALKALTLATQQTLGASAQLTVSGERANVALQGVRADALAQWLTQCRVNARSTPVEARLARVVPSQDAGKDPAAGSLWNGVLVMSLPAR